MEKKYKCIKRKIKWFKQFSRFETRRIFSFIFRAKIIDSFSFQAVIFKQSECIDIEYNIKQIIKSKWIEFRAKEKRLNGNKKHDEWWKNSLTLEEWTKSENWNENGGAESDGKYRATFSY